MIKTLGVAIITNNSKSSLQSIILKYYWNKQFISIANDNITSTQISTVYHSLKLALAAIFHELLGFLQRVSSSMGYVQLHINDAE